jgi:nicotinamidase-related amidase
MARKANPITTPTFYDPDKVGQIYLPRYDAIIKEAIEFRRQGLVRPAIEDKYRIAVFSIDEQVGFAIPGASLFVPGAVEDSRRGVEFIYRNLGVITELEYSLDTHRAFQIFFPTFWLDADGRHPDPFTIITTKEIREGKWRPALYPIEAAAYAEELERTGKYVLIIWPFHTMLGSVDYALVPAAFEAALFHAIARQKQTAFETKGTHPLTENYSVLEPEVKQLKVGGNVLSIGQFNAKFFKALMENDRVYLKGEAKSHCVKATIESLLDKILADDPTLVKKVYILEDCMSPVPAVRDAAGNLLSPDFPAIADEAIEKFRAAGMNVVKSTDPVEF